MQVVAVTLQLAQLLLQGRHWVPDWKVPTGQVATQLVPLSNGVADPAVQVAHPAPDVHVPQVAWHGLHTVPFE